MRRCIVRRVTLRLFDELLTGRIQVCQPLWLPWLLARQYNEGSSFCNITCISRRVPGLPRGREFGQDQTKWARGFCAAVVFLIRCSLSLPSSNFLPIAAHFMIASKFCDIRCKGLVCRVLTTRGRSNLSAHLQVAGPASVDLVTECGAVSKQSM